jgi:hypothetical protein
VWLGEGGRVLEFSRSVSFIHRSKLIPSPSHPVMPYSFQFHPDIETFLEATVRTPFPLRLINDAIPVRYACVHFLVLHRTLEKSFTGLTGQQPVVVPRHLVSTDWTEFFKSVFTVSLLTLTDSSPILHSAACKYTRVCHETRYM